MEHIAELFGLGFLSAAAALGIIKIYMMLFETGGVLHLMVCMFMRSICG